jgi:UDP-N-acetylglucosamine--N-acetylmuramyl-(pentapeptide) pyrophosphoryl-undecaprenol N-acetylglucosamine transferase
MVQAARVVDRFRPDLVIGTGGYASGPVALLAAMYGIPLAVHEQNSYPGVTTRLLARRASQVFLTYPESVGHFRSRRRLYVCGNPVRGAIGGVDRATAVARLGLDGSRQTLMVTGGSQGAHRINEALLDALPRLARLQTLQIVWHTGKRDYQLVKEEARRHTLPILVQDFIDDMPSAYAAADLLVSRAGANTLAEFTVCGLPAILIPLPTAAAHHQETNARVLADAGAACVLVEQALTGQELAEQIIGLLQDPGRLEEMRRASSALGRPDAARRIVDLLLRHQSLAANQPRSRQSRPSADGFTEARCSETSRESISWA